MSTSETLVDGSEISVDISAGVSESRGSIAFDYDVREVSGVRLSMSMSHVIERRGQWNSRLDYLMVLLGYAIGIGNIWRFPYLVAQNGGGAFVVAYLVCLLFIVAPVFLMELIWGQQTQKSTMECLKSIHPRWLGVGISSAILVVLVTTYYNLLLAYCLLYIYHSFNSTLPWTGSPNAAEEFWENDILGRITEAQLERGEMGKMHGHIVLALVIVYIFIALALCKGHKSLAGAAKVMVITPVVLLTVLLVRTFTLDGMEKGLEFYLGTFDSDKLRSGNVWAAACGQIMFSLSPGMGTAITMSSYAPLDEDVFKVNAIVTICNSTFSLIGGLAIFGILGHVSHESCLGEGLDCRSVADLASESGSGLAFISIAAGLGTFGDGWAQSLSVLFFLMLFTLGLDSSFAWMETVNTYVNDFLAERNPTNRPAKWKTAVTTSVIFFLFGLPFCTGMGNYILNTFDHFATTYVLLIVVWFELVALIVDYGVENLSSLERKVPFIWRICLKYVAPTSVLALTIFLVVEDVQESYEGYPPNLIALGWNLAFVPVLPILYYICKYSRPVEPESGSGSRYWVSFLTTSQGNEETQRILPPSAPPFPPTTGGTFEQQHNMFNPLATLERVKAADGSPPMVPPGDKKEDKSGPPLDELLP